MNIYLIDFENVNSQGLHGINRLDSGDQVIIFYSENADSMTFELHQQINESKAYIYFQKVDVGTKNALDFQLATYLGYLVCENEKAQKQAVYYVVTKDHGFASLISYWTKRGVDISQMISLESGRTADAASKEPKDSGDGGKDSSESKNGRKKEEPDAKKELRVQVEQVVTDKAAVDLVVSYIQKYKTKQGINNALAKEFKDSKKASEIYKSIKPLIVDKKGR